MDSVKKNESFPKLNLVENSTNPKPDECVQTIKEEEDSGKSDPKHVETSPGDTKITMEMKKSTHPSCSQMVLDSIKSLKMLKGTPTYAILKYIEDHYRVDIKSVTPSINKFLKTGVQRGILEKISGTGVDNRFKIKKTGKSTAKAKFEKAEKYVLRKDRNVSIKGKLTPKKMPNHPPTSEMVIESIKSLKMRNGASFQAISEYMEGHYNISIKSMKGYIKRFLKTGVEKGILEQVSGDGLSGRFKIKKMDRSYVQPKTKDTGKIEKLTLKRNRKNVKDTKVSLMISMPNHPSTSKMVIETIKSLKMRNGSSFEEIGEYIEGHYNVSLESMKPHINSFLKTGVQKGILKQASGIGVNGRFKINNMKDIKKDKQHLTDPKDQKNKKGTTTLSRLDFYQ